MQEFAIKDLKVRYERLPALDALAGTALVAELLEPMLAGAASAQTGSLGNVSVGLTRGLHKLPELFSLFEKNVKVSKPSIGNGHWLELSTVRDQVLTGPEVTVAMLAQLIVTEYGGFLAGGGLAAVLPEGLVSQFASLTGSIGGSGGS